jgi:hypothetical protein
MNKMMNDEFTIILIACLCSVTTIVVVMFINTTCAFQEKLDEQEKIIEREKIIHRQREEEQEQKFLKKQVEYEQKIERAFALIEARDTKINELVLLNKEKCDEFIQCISLQEKIMKCGYVKFSAIVPPHIYNKQIFRPFRPYMGKLSEVINSGGINHCNANIKEKFYYAEDADILDNKIFVMTDILYNGDDVYHRDKYIADKITKEQPLKEELIKVFDKKVYTSLDYPEHFDGKNCYTNNPTISNGSLLAGEISKYFPNNTYVINNDECSTFYYHLPHPDRYKSKYCTVDHKLEITYNTIHTVLHVITGRVITLSNKRTRPYSGEFDIGGKFI